MTIALLFPDDSVFTFDAVLSYAKSYSSNISSHPIDKSATITDHISKNNPTLTIQGIVSSADFHSPITRSYDFTSDFSNNLQNDSPVEPITIQDNYPLESILPGFIQERVFDKKDANIAGVDFRGYLHQSARDRLTEAWEQSYTLTVLDYDYEISLGRSVSVRRYTNVVITNFTDNEDLQTGDSIELTITLEKIRYAFIKEVDIQVASAPVQDSAAKETNLGNQSNSPETSDIESQERVNSWNRDDGFFDQINNALPNFNTRMAEIVAE